MGLLGNAAEIFPELVKRGVRPDAVTDQTSGPRSAERLSADRLDPCRMAGKREREKSARVDAGREANRWPSMSAPCSTFHEPGACRPFDYGNNIRQEALRIMGVENAFDFPGFVPAYIRPLFCRGVGPFRWAALSGDPEDIYRTDAKVKELIPDNPHLHNWLDMARTAHPLPGPAVPHLLGRPGRPAPARPRLQRDGRRRAN